MVRLHKLIKLQLQKLHRCDKTENTELELVFYVDFDRVLKKNTVKHSLHNITVSFHNVSSHKHIMGTTEVRVDPWIQVIPSHGNKGLMCASKMWPKRVANIKKGFPRHTVHQHHE